MAETLEEVDRAFDRIGRPLGLRSVPRGTFPPINVYEQDEAVVVTVTVGKAKAAKPKKVKITAAK